MRACQTANALLFLSLEESLANYSRVELIHLNMLQIDLPVINMTDGYYSSASHPMEHFLTVHYIPTMRCCMEKQVPLLFSFTRFMPECVRNLSNLEMILGCKSQHSMISWPLRNASVPT
jgi:hypothetical protein